MSQIDQRWDVDQLVLLLRLSSVEGPESFTPQKVDKKQMKPISESERKPVGPKIFKERREGIKRNIILRKHMSQICAIISDDYLFQC